MSVAPEGVLVSEIDLSADWRVGRGLNGGYVAGVLLAAMHDVVADPARPARSLTVHYLRPAAPGAARLETRLERPGRSLSALSCRLVQGGSTAALALAAFSAERPGPAWQDLARPDAPSPEALASSSRQFGFTRNWDARPVVGAPPLSGAPTALSGGWLRALTDTFAGAPLLAAMADSWMPAAVARLSERPGFLPTIDLTVHFHAELPVGGWAFVLFRSDLAGGGQWEEDGTIWSPEGRVLARSRQLALFV
ncbi:MAG: thioesterase family protein [Candidatus Dormibacteraeota bacterium]|nr:thioesterase family protein [Candidatus Dormibacteraeota bacterium]